MRSLATWLSLVWLALASIACCFGDPAGFDPDDTALTADMRDRIAARMPEATVTITGVRTLTIARDGADIGEVSLDNLAAECASAPDLCEAARQHFAEAMADAIAAVGTETAVAPEQVRAVVHERDWIDTAGREHVVSRPFLGDLEIVYVVDQPASIGTLAPESRAALALDDEALHALALRNMEVALAAFPIVPLDGSPGVSVLRTGDSYEAARAILHPRWAAVAGTVRGELLVSLPCRDAVLIAGSADPAHVAELRARTAAMHASEHHPISATVLRWTPERWVVHD